MYLTGSVLDYGAGLQPYRRYVESVGGVYVPWDRVGLPGSVATEDAGPHDPLKSGWDTIVCTQVLQYVLSPFQLLKDFYYALLTKQGVLLLTYATNWDEVEDEDLWRFTKAGMERLLFLAGFEVLSHERRAEVSCNDFTFPLGYGVVARAVPHARGNDDY